MRVPLIALALFIAGCGQAPSRSQHGVSTDPEAATGFITANGAPPDTAEDSRGDGVLRDADGRPYGYALLNQPLPDISAPFLDGSVWQASDLDSWTIIDVWGIWCGDCRADAPYAAALASAVDQDPELEFLSIHTPPSARRAEDAFGDYGSVEAYFSEKGYSYPTVVDADASLRDALQIAWTPTYLLVSPEGVVRGFRTDLSVSGELAVKTFLQDVAEVRSNMAGEDLAALSFQGPGAVIESIPFTQAALGAAYTGLNVRASTGENAPDGVMYPVYRVSVPSEPGNPSEVIFTIWPDWDRSHVAEVATRSRRAEGPGGTRIGQTRLADLPEEFGANCVETTSNGRGTVACEAFQNGRAVFRWVFKEQSLDSGVATLLEEEGEPLLLLASMSYFPSPRPR